MTPSQQKAAFQAGVASQLSSNGYYSMGRSCELLLKDLEDDFQIRIRYEYRRRSGFREVEPVIELNNVRLQILRQDEPGVECYGIGMICFTYFSSIKAVRELWGGEYGGICFDEKDISDAIARTVDAITRFAESHLVKYATPSAATALLVDMISRPDRARKRERLAPLDVVTICEEPKLIALGNIYPQ